MAQVQVKKVSNWMEALSDFMIQHPQCSAHEAALFFDKTESWISIVKNSDQFREYHAQRRDAHASRISEDVVGKVGALTEISLDALTEKVEEGRETLPVSTLKDVAELGLKAMGFGGRGPSVLINQDNRQMNDNRQVHIADTEALHEAREIMKRVRDENDRVLEGEAEEVHPAGQNALVPA